MDTNNHTIKRISRSKSDIENLSRLRTSITTEIDTNDYKGIVVNKPWGYEYLMYENQYVAIWILYLKHNNGTSMHCHPNKKTCYIVLSGIVKCLTLEGWMVREAGDGLIIDEGVFHCTRVVSEPGAMLMEIESPPNKKDLVRLKDEYGRENQGYEGPEKMSKILNQYEYIDFHNVFSPKRRSKNLRNCKLSISFIDHSDNVHQKIKREFGHILCLLQGKLHNLNGETVLFTGEAEMLSKIQSHEGLVTFGKITYLTINYKKT